MNFCASFTRPLRDLYRNIPKYAYEKQREKERERGWKKGDKREREREREADEGCVKICKRVQRPLRHRGLYELRPRHILLFLVSGRGGGENSFDAYKARLKSESAKKKRKKYRDDIASILGSCVKRDDFFLPLFSFFVQVEERLARDGGDEITTKGKGWRVCFTTSRFQNDTVPQGGLRLRWHCLDMF